MASEQVLTALEKLHKELNSLTPAIRHVEIAEQVTKAFQSIPAMQLRLVEQIKEEDADFKKNLSDSAAEIQQQVKKEQQYLAELKDRVNNYYDKIERIAFPERLDKLDNSVSSIVLAIQSTQNRIENLERNLTDRIKEGSEQQRQMHAILQDAISKATRKQRVTAYITWTIMVVLAALFIASRTFLH
jgi:uncharacterized phage infection (PIP) family protein YhgE